jgi:hypothetical protein
LRNGLPRFGAGGLHILLELAQPPDEVRATDQEPPTRWWGDGVREHLRESAPLEVEISTGVEHRGVEPGVAEPLASSGHTAG